MENKPLKRSVYMMALSREHHEGLLFSWKIKEGIKKGIPFWRLNKYADFFWSHHLQRHFKQQEELLFSLINNALTKRGLDEHKLLKEGFWRIQNNLLRTNEEYLVFAELLINHIRFEERELFPYLEKELPAVTLMKVGEILAGNHEPFEDDYSDEFWINEVTN
jgi:hemerythrin-like domain-containing protein